MVKGRRALFLLALALAAAVAACSSSSRGAAPTEVKSANPTPTVRPVAFEMVDVHIGSRVVRMEVASTEEQLQRGLGHRDALDPDAGMVFDLHAVRVQEFWMKGMQFPLDLVWIDAAKRVVDVTSDLQPESGVPDEQLRRYRSPSPVRYVIEVNAGAVQRLGLTAGAQLAFDLSAGS